MDKIALIGGTKKFYEYLLASGGNIVPMNDVSKAIADESLAGMILLPEYEDGKEMVEQMSVEDIEVLAGRKRKGFRVFAENYYCFNYYQCSVFGYETTGKICHISNENLCAQRGLQYKLGGDRILQASGAAYIPAAVNFRDPYVHEQFVLLAKGNYIGTSQIAAKVVRPDPMLIQSGSVYSCLLSMTNFDTVGMRPNCRWKKVFSAVFSKVLNIPAEGLEKAFEAFYPPLETRMKPDDVIPMECWREKEEQALMDAVKWHFDSGVILGDGTTGSVEMILSSNLELYKARRGDAGLYTGWLTYAAGKYFKNEKWQQVGLNNFEYFLEHAQLQGGNLDGMFAWYTHKDAGPLWVWCIDSGRCGIALCNMYRLTGKEEYKDRIKRLADGFLRWMDGDLLKGCRQAYDDPLVDRPFEKAANRTPDFYSEMGAFMTMAHKIIGKQEYLDAVVKVAKKLVDSYPDNFEFHGHTTSARNARFLMLLTSVHLAGGADYTDMINHLIEYIGSLQMPCGGIYSEDNMNFERGDPNFSANDENGITTPWDNDRISDQLYCVNNAVASLSLLNYVPEDSGIHKKEGLNILHKLLEYVVKIQIVREDKRFHGGWMRAFCMNLGEYYGLNMDKYWGPYCIMAGWTMGIIPLALLGDLENRSPYMFEA
ncbi:MAG: hypothetical protein E7329_08355 [Clostridiales bacterium]|nr:hypothetical protein [Clostridiales bacterium]